MDTADTERLAQQAGVCIENARLAVELAERDDMDGADRALDGCGVEYISGPDDLNGPELAYVNTGETYQATLCRCGERVWVGSWGDWFESAEQEHEHETDTIRCGHCGHYTPRGDGEWRAVVCEQCDHNVAG